VYFACESVYVNCDIVNCVFCCQLKGAEKSVLEGGIMNFRWPGCRPTKIHAQLFLSATTGADENTCPAIFVGHHRGRRKFMPSYFRRPPPGPT
jgi:hypothetical protein